MLTFIKKLFSKPSPVLAMQDPDFGRITFFANEADESKGIWQMDVDWKLPNAFAEVGCSSIPGTPSGPYLEARLFLLGKRDSLLEVWGQVAEHLEKVRAKWRQDTGTRPLKEVFYLSSLGLDEPITNPPSWDVSFEPREGFWVFATFQFQGNVIVGTTCDT
jgi:hypothetical protein